MLIPGNPLPTQSHIPSHNTHKSNNNKKIINSSCFGHLKEVNKVVYVKNKFKEGIFNGDVVMGVVVNGGMWVDGVWGRIQGYKEKDGEWGIEQKNKKNNDEQGIEHQNNFNKNNDEQGIEHSNNKNNNFNKNNDDQSIEHQNNSNKINHQSIEPNYNSYPTLFTAQVLKQSPLTLTATPPFGPSPPGYTLPHKQNKFVKIKNNEIVFMVSSNGWVFVSSLFVDVWVYVVGCVERKECIDYELVDQMIK